MANGCDLINKNHYIGLKNLCGISEVSDITKSEYSHNLLTRYHDIDNSGVLNNSANDLSSCLPEANSKERTYFDYCVL